MNVSVWLESYQWSVLIVGLTAMLSIVQLLAFDFMAIKQRHPPGHPVTNDHNSLLFRLSRAHANMNETMGAMILLFLFVLFTSADPRWVNGLMGCYFICRLLHMVFYYAGQAALRGVVFGISLLALIGLFVVGIMAWLAA